MSAILLDPAASRRCPVRTKYDFAPSTRAPQVGQLAGRACSAVAQELRTHVFDAMQAALGPRFHRVGLRRAEQETAAAMRAGMRVIADPMLPADEGGGRCGSPDFLVATNDGYLPGLVLGYPVLRTAPGASVQVSTLTRPWEPLQRSDMQAHVHSDDLFDLAHHTRTLEAAARHAGPYVGFVVYGGDAAESDRPGAADRVLVRCDLTRRSTRDLVTLDGAADESVLAQYDREHAARLEIASAAVAGRDVDLDAFPGVQLHPVGQEECRDCAYRRRCRAEMPDGEASAALGGDHLGVAEWAALRSCGIRTLQDVADIDMDDADVVAPLVASMTRLRVEDAERALAVTVGHARMLAAGQVAQRRGVGPLEVPAADVEIDTDIRWDGMGRVIQWGGRVRRGQDDASATVLRGSSIDGGLDDAGERHLAERFVVWLRSLVDTERAAGRTVAVFPRSSLEEVQLRRLVGEDALDGLVGPDGVYVDLRRFVEREFTLARGEGVGGLAAALGIPGAGMCGPFNRVTEPLEPVMAAAVRDEMRRRWGDAPTVDDAGDASV